MSKNSVLLLLVLMGAARFVSMASLKSGTTRNSLLEQQVLGLLENLRELMKTGSDDIPIMDPLEIQHLHVDEDVVDLPGAHLTVNGLLVKYASTFVVDRLSISLTSLILQRYSVEFEGHIPILDVKADEYDLFISAMDVEIFGRGDGKVQMIKPKVSGSMTFRLWSVSISNTVIQFGLDGFEPELTGLFYHEGASEFANSFLRNLIPELVQFFENGCIELVDGWQARDGSVILNLRGTTGLMKQEDITALLSTLVQDLANQILGDVSIGDLLPQLYRVFLPVRDDKM